MEPKITVGMEFGTYSKTIAKLRERFEEFKDESPKRENLVISKESYKYYRPIDYPNEVSATASKKVSIYLINDSTYEKRYSINANFDGFSYSNRGNTKNDDDRFTFINTNTQMAYDKNGNGIVDDGEIYDKQ